MNFLKKYIGLCSIIAGTLLLAATRFAAASYINTLLLTGLLLIIAGIILHIRCIKSESPY